MKKTVLIYGIIAGLISTSLFIGLMLLGKAGHDFKNGMIYGYTLMILAFSFIFVATKITRDKYNGGVISFGKAFRVGLYITLIASTIYVIVWLVDYYFFIPDFAEKYSAHVLENLKTSGASEAEIAKKSAEMAGFSEMYKNPFFNALITYSEIVPVGLIVSLISALALKRKRKDEFSTAV
ncbi:MAG: DUF4199 domain-containing protein [Bacteroidota bacterium]